MTERRCLTRLPDGSHCKRDGAGADERGIVHAHCGWCERRLLREAFGPQSWQDRAAVNELPTMVVGGVPVIRTDPAPGASAEPPVSPEQVSGRRPRRRARALAAVQAAE